LGSGSPSAAYSVPVAEIVTAFNTLESDTFSPVNLRAWLKAQLGQ
jgi:hypothetical protein